MICLIPAPNVMAKTCFFSPLLFLLLFTTIRVILSANSPNISTDQSALLALKSHITHDPHNILATNWSTSTSVCNWIGVTCESKHHRAIALDLSSLDLTGTIPSQLGNLSFLIRLFINNNSFHGVLPIELSNLHAMRALNFGNNNFDGEIPSWFGYFVELQLLWLYGNNFIGVIPSTLANLSKLVLLNLFNNNLQGQIPAAIGNLSNLEWLYLYNNSLSGQIPSSICNLSSLLDLSLWNNSLDGKIPECIGSLSSSLSIVDLRMNNFHGKIPKHFGKGCPLHSFRISNNKIEGSLPRSLGNCKNLKLLEVGNNYLNDTFPYWLGNLDQLQVLIMRWNGFYGQVDSADIIVSFPRLRVIDLSHNSFSGYLPTNFFENLLAIKEGYGKKGKPEYMGDILQGAMWDYDYFSFTTKGLEIEFEKLLTIWTALDFSDNQFCGEIPKALGELHSLIVLNLSHNSLTGLIPSSLADLSELESLDLSSNQLHGRIPTELKNLGFLEVLNLSRNNLVGPIPQGKQFDTSTNDSYRENVGLFGLPLSKCCDNDEETPTKVDPYGDDGDGLNWKFSILMGYGCGLVLGLSMGYIVFTTGKPQWFIRVYERVGQISIKVEKRTL